MIIDSKLFDEKLLKELDYTNTDVYITHKLSARFPGENLIMRPLCRNDYKKNYINYSLRGNINYSEMEKMIVLPLFQNNIDNKLLTIFNEVYNDNYKKYSIDKDNLKNIKNYIFNK